MDAESLVPKNLLNSSAPTSSDTITTRDFLTIREIGEGSYSTVYYARQLRPVRREVAIKMCVKRHIMRYKQQHSIMREKKILAKLSMLENIHPFTLILYCTTQDAEHLYFIVSYASRGDIARYMAKQPSRCLSSRQAQFYTAELVLALEHLHKLQIIHRDIKPDNMLIQENWHLLICDFGSAIDRSVEQRKEQSQMNFDGDGADGDVITNKFSRRRASFVGTAQYVAPEILNGVDSDEMVDFWAMGVSLYQLLSGKHCFQDQSDFLIFRRIQSLMYAFPPNFTSNAKDLIGRLLKLEPSERLGSARNGGIENLKAHSFFANIDWDKLPTCDPLVLFNE